MMGQNPKGHEVSGANARSIGDRPPHLENGRDDKALSGKTIHDLVGGCVHRETTKNRLGDVTDHRVVSVELEVIGRSRTQDGFVLRQ